ncbi:MAG: hypothetical protein HUJ31_19790 [Pseudomonadales bacterium]|nr:hypothetical protein [Pseudomonadales bacterium]
MISDEEISRILNVNYQPPKLSRVALLPAGWISLGRWSEELAVATEELEADAITTLRTSPYVYDAAFLPSILIPETRSVPFLREAAARFQADLLLAYKSGCRSFEKYRLFRPDTARAYCSVEAVLLDVRTGLVPFTITVTETYEVSTGAEDMNLRESILKAQLQAMTKAMNDISARTVTFLAESIESGGA